MFVAQVETIDYVQDVPHEMTESAIKAGMIRKGAVVGITVHPVEDASNRALIEVRLTEDGQAEFLKTGVRIPLEGQGSRFHFAQGWAEYLRVTAESQEDAQKEYTLRPQPRAFC